MKQICFLIILALPYLPCLSQENKKTGSSFRDCKDCPEMIMIPAGVFNMGAPKSEAGAYPEEGPQHRVTIKKLAVGKYDITRAQWAMFVSATHRTITGGCAWSGLAGDTIGKLNPAASWQHLGFVQDDNHPVVCISWYDAQDYVQWLSRKSGSHYRLLTEGEWEYAARAGTTTAYPWGDTASHEFANYGADSGFTGLAKGRDKWMNTSPVGAFPPNAFGLYDMQGNVLQYVEDCFGLYATGITGDGTAYTSATPLIMQGELAFMNGTNPCAYRIARGGDFGDPPAMLRSASRNWAPSGSATLRDYRSAGLGFRVARSFE